MSRRKSRPKKQPGSRRSKRAAASSRDITSMLTYGPQFTPYAAAWTDNRTEQVRSFKHWVFVAIDRIASSLASKLPNISKVTGSHLTQEGPTKHFREKALTPLNPREGLSPLPANHPMVRLFKDPNDPDTAYDLIYETVLFLGLTGNAYWWVPKNGFGVPESIWVLPAHWMWPIVGKDRLIDGWELHPVEGNYLRKTLPADEVIHFRRKNPISKIDGHSPLTAGSQWVDVQQAVNESQYHAYRNGIFPTVSVEFEPGMNDPTAEQLDRIHSRIISRYGRETGSNRPLFVPPGMKVRPLSIKANEMVFGETTRQTRDYILALFGVPSVVAGISDNMTYGSVQAALWHFCSFTLNSWATFLGQAISEKFAPWYDSRDDIRLWWEDFTPSTPEQRERDIKTMLMSASITPNEVRSEYGYEPLDFDWANKPVKPVNMEGTTPLGGEHHDPDYQPDTNLPD